MVRTYEPDSTRRSRPATSSSSPRGIRREWSAESTVALDGVETAARTLEGASTDAKEVWVRGNPQVRIAQEQDGAALEPTASGNGPTATASGIPLRSADFTTLAEALDYAARGDSGFNFYDGRGALIARLPYRDLRARALELAKRLAPLGRGQRLALVADTHPDFAVMLYACQYAGLVAVPLPAAVHLGGREVYIRHLRKLMRDCEAVAAFAPPAFIGFLREATDGLPLALSGTMDEFMALDAADELPPPPEAARALLSPVHLGQHALPARDHDHPGGRDGQPEGDLQPRLPARRRRSLLLLAAVLPRHGPGRHRAGLRRHAALGRLPADPRLRDAAAPVADAGLAQSLHRLVQPAVRLHPGRPAAAPRRRRGARPLRLARRRRRRRDDPPRVARALRRAARARRLQGELVPALLRHGRVLARGQLRAPRARRRQRLDRHRRAVARGRGPPGRRPRGRQGQGLHQLRRARFPATRSRSATRPAGPCPSGTAAGSSCADRA